MKNLGNALTIVAILMVIYSILGRYVGAPTIGLGLFKINAISGVIMAIFFIVLGIAIKLWDQ